MWCGGWSCNTKAFVLLQFLLEKQTKKNKKCTNLKKNSKGKWTGFFSLSCKWSFGLAFQHEFFNFTKKKKRLFQNVFWDLLIVEHSMEARESFSWKSSGTVDSSIYCWEVLILFHCHRSVPPSAGTEKCSISGCDCWWHLYSPLQQDGEPGQSKGLCLRLCSRAWEILKPFKVFVLQVREGLRVMQSSPTENYSPFSSW